MTLFALLPMLFFQAAGSPRDLISQGEEHFIQGRIEESIAAFDRAAALAPDAAPHLWQRGIAYYYAGRFEDGRRQFESHRLVNPNDVENAAWWYLCMARLGRRDEARAKLLPVGPDDRVPMTEIYALYAGRGAEKEVLAAVGRGKPGDAERRLREFYARLYLGLYAEAGGDATGARRHLQAAVDQRVGGYMWQVARIHLTTATKPR
jgi:lipoprotein NlpI